MTSDSERLPHPGSGGADAPAPAAVAVSGLVHDYPDGYRALQGVDLSVAAGERVALLGPNGAGKTTLALHLNGILTPTQGSVRIAGTEVTAGNLRQVRADVGMVFQDPDDQLFMPTVAQDVAFGPINFGVPAEQVARRVDEALAAVGMSVAAPAYPGHLSFGQRRRVAIATVLACHPQVLVLDEPTSNLDPAARRDLAEVLLKLPIAMLLITHDLPFAWQLCPRSVVLDDGRICADAPTRQLLRDTATLTRHRLELPYGFDPAARTE